MKKNKPCLLPPITLHTQKYTQQIIKLNVGPKTIKLLEGNREKKLTLTKAKIVLHTKNQFIKEKQ